MNSINRDTYGNPGDLYGRRGAGEPAVTEALPAAELSPYMAETEDPDITVDPASHLPDEEPFVPKSRYTPGRSTKVLVCVLLVVGGLFGGSAIQKQIDAGTRGSRTNFGNFQGAGGAGAGTGSGAGTTNGSGTQTPGQGRRAGGNGNTGSSAPAAGSGQ
jgi:hypothetical protein